MTKRQIVSRLEKLALNLEKEGKEFKVYTGKQAREKGFEYVGNANWFVTFDGSNLYDAFNHYDDWSEIGGSCYDRDNEWSKWCKENGLHCELAHSWSMAIWKEENYGM